MFLTMAECANCKIGVGCGCNLTNGLCKNCYAATKSVSVSTKPVCSLTIPKLNMIFQSLNKKPRTALVNHQLKIVESQISQFNTDPCKFEKFISNIQL